MHAIINAVPGIEVFNCLNRQTTGQDVSNSGLKDYLLQMEYTTRKEAPTSAMLYGHGYRRESGRERGEGRSGSVSRETRCYSCERHGHLARDYPTPRQRVCYICYKPGHEARDCQSRKQE